MDLMNIRVSTISSVPWRALDSVLGEAPVSHRTKGGLVNTSSGKVRNVHPQGLEVHNKGREGLLLGEAGSGENGIVCS